MYYVELDIQKDYYEVLERVGNYNNLKFSEEESLVWAVLNEAVKKQIIMEINDNGEVYTLRSLYMKQIIDLRDKIKVFKNGIFMTEGKLVYIATKDYMDLKIKKIKQELNQVLYIYL